MSFKRFYYGLIYSVQNLFIWFIIIWKDRSWDEHHIYTLLRLKLQLMEKSFTKYDIHTSAERKVKEIKTCRILLDRLVANEYAEEEWSEAVDYDNWKLNTLLTEEDRRLLKIAQEKEIYMREQDIDMLFKLLRKYIEGWWH